MAGPFHLCYNNDVLTTMVTVGIQVPEVMVAWHPPKLLVGVRISRDLPFFCYTYIMKTKIFDHNSYEYQMRAIGVGRHHGCYYYSKEIVENIIPLVDTDRNWVTVNVPGRCWDHSIVFIHNNLNPRWYRWLNNYKDLVLVCSLPFAVENMKKVCPKHKVVFIPLSVDVEYVKQFRTKKTKKAAYAGRLVKLNKNVPEERRAIPDDIDIIGGMDRESLLKAMAPYKTIYAVGRTAIEAKILGAKIGIYNNLCPQDVWTVLDNSEAASVLQEKLDIIDKKEE